jgi:hypothetical protein
MERVSIFMNKKDLKTLSESYEKIFEKTISNILKENEDDIMMRSNPVQDIVSTGLPSSEGEANVGISMPVSTETNKDKEMVIANLKILIAHAQKSLSFIQSGKCLEAWMNDKVSVASNDIVQVSNAIEFGEH